MSLRESQSSNGGTPDLEVRARRGGTGGTERQEGPVAGTGRSPARLGSGEAPAAPGTDGGGRREGRPPGGRRIRLRARIAAWVLVVVVTAGLLEGLAYVYLRVAAGYDGVHLMTYQFDDYKNIQLTPGYRNTRGVAHNRQGFRRTTDVTREKPAGVYRVFLMGGSTAYGLQSLSRYGQARYPVIRNDETIDHYLERYLEDRLGAGRVEVINAAITSHQSHHHLIYLNQTVLKYSPDMVVFIDGFNDYYEYQKGFDQFRSYAYQERAHRMLMEPSVEAWATYSGWWLFRKSHAVHLAGRTLLPVWQRISRIGRERARIDDIPAALENLRANARTNFLSMVERNALILRHQSVVPVFTLQPELVFRQAKVLTPMERDIYRELSTEWQVHYVEFKNAARPVVAGLLREATARTGAAFIDLTDPFGGMSEDAYTDYCHLTPMGNKRLAEYLGERLLPILKGEERLPDPAPPPALRRAS